MRTARLPPRASAPGERGSHVSVRSRAADAYDACHPKSAFVFLTSIPLAWLSWALLRSRAQRRHSPDAPSLFPRSLCVRPLPTLPTLSWAICQPFHPFAVPTTWRQGSVHPSPLRRPFKCMLDCIPTLGTRVMVRHTVPCSGAGARLSQRARWAGLVGRKR